MFGFVYLFFGTQKETFPEFRDIAVADGIVENIIIIYGCDIFQGMCRETRRENSCYRTALQPNRGRGTEE